MLGSSRSSSDSLPLDDGLDSVEVALIFGVARMVLNLSINTFTSFCGSDSQSLDSSISSCFSSIVAGSTSFAFFRPAVCAVAVRLGCFSDRFHFRLIGRVSSSSLKSSGSG